MLSAWLAANDEAIKSGRFWKTWFLSFGLLGLAFVINYFAGLYATERASSPVTDIILSNIRVYDVDGIFAYGAIAFWICIAFVLLADLRLSPFALKSVSLFTLIRSFFVSLTHIGPFQPDFAVRSVQVVNKVTFGGDLFFSGHTGLPFLMALVFWENKRLRYFCLASSVFFATCALLGHFHYSIDVFAAYFMTYSIFHLARVAFSSDLRLFKSSPFVAGVDNRSGK